VPEAIASSAPAAVRPYSVAPGQGEARYVYMDGLRGIAAVGVLMSHLFNHFFTAFSNPEEGSVAGLWVGSTPLSAFYNGQFSVYIFFVLSGFVLSASASHSRLSLPSTLVRRYLRLTVPVAGITLLFLIAARAGLFFNGLVVESAPHAAALYPLDYKPTFLEWIEKSIYGTYLTGDYLLDGVVWTMKVEIWGSLLVFAVWRFLRVEWQRMLLCAAGYFAVTFLLDKHSSLQGLQLFPVGILIYDLSLYHPLKRLRPRNAVALGGVVLLIGVMCGAWRAKDPAIPGIEVIVEHVLEPVFGNISRYQVAQVGSILVVAALAMTTQLHRPMSGRLSAYLGAISFPLYLVHQLVIVSAGCLLFAWTYERYGVEAARWVTIPVTLALALGAATLLTVLIERPSVRLSRRAGATMDRYLHRFRGAAEGPGGKIEAGTQPL
jgi:peptidoglycan/LPS O-acetylase OafA/YrhL